MDRENVATYKRSREWPRVRANVSAISDIARAAREAAKAIPHEDDADNPIFRVTIEMPGVEDSFTSEAEFQHERATGYPVLR